MRPLEPRLEHATDPPVGIAEMIVDGRVFRLELDGAFELLDRFIDSCRAGNSAQPSESTM